MKLCGARNGWYCTLPANEPHEEHVATIGPDGPVVFRWKDGDPPPPPHVPARSLADDLFDFLRLIEDDWPDPDRRRKANALIARLIEELPR